MWPGPRSVSAGLKTAWRLRRTGCPAASFVAHGLAGVFMAGYSYMAFIVGWTGGYILVATLMAPYLRKFGCYTVPDFIGTRYGGKLTRFAAVVRAGRGVVHLCDGTDHGHGYHRSTPRSSSPSSGAYGWDLPVSWSARCWAACALLPGPRWPSTSC